MFLSAATDTAGTTTAAPWWGVPLIAGSFLLIGAIIGAIGVVYTKRKELDRLDHARWDDEILDIAISIVDKCQKIANNKFKDEESPQIWLQKMQMYANDLQHYLPQYRKLDLIASPSIAHAANQYIAAALGFVGQMEPDDIARAQRELNEAQNEFRAVVRKELRAKK